MTDPVSHPRSAEEELPLAPEEFRRFAEEIEGRVRSVIVGQQEAVWGTLVSLIAGRHALLEGVPGLGKTSIALSFARALSLSYRRIQFTPDLMPADITGTTVMMQEPHGGMRLAFEPGPVFANLVLADEINRATPKTQSALLEAMQERTVTVGETSRPLPEPFSVLATQNPIEMHGTYPLPEAQLDRFFLKLRLEFPSEEAISEIVRRTAVRDDPVVEPVGDADTLLRMNALARSVPAAEHVVDYASRIVVALQPAAADASQFVRECVRVGPSPRGAQSMTIAGRVRALLEGRINLAFDDVRAVAAMALRHRLLLTFDAERRGISPEVIIADALERVPEEP
jgi:MoxR-like ATPase